MLVKLKNIGNISIYYNSYNKKLIYLKNIFPWVIILYIPIEIVAGIKERENIWKQCYQKNLV